MKTVMKFVMLSVVMSLFATMVVADTVTTPKDMTVSCKKPKPDRQDGLIRYKGDTNQWTFRLVLADGARLVKDTKAQWSYPGKGQMGADWGLWAIDEENDPQHLKITWSSPDTTGKFHVTVSGKITCGDGPGGGEPIDFEAGWDGVIPTITEIAVTTGATKTNMKQDYPDAGDQNWGCVKSAGDYVEVKATTGPNNDESEWDEISWNSGVEVPGKKNNYRRFSRDSSAKFEVKPTIDGEGPKPLYIWVIWGTYTIHLNGTLIPGQICDNTFQAIVVDDKWVQLFGGTDQLGPTDHCRNHVLSYHYAVGRTHGVVQLSPGGIGKVVIGYKNNTHNWGMRRKATRRVFLNGVQLTSYDQNDQDDSSHDYALDLDPAAAPGADMLYDADVPGIASVPPTDIQHTAELYYDFTACGEITLDGTLQCTDMVEYNYQARIDIDAADATCAEIDRNLLSYGHLEMPTQAYYPHR